MTDQRVERRERGGDGGRLGMIRREKGKERRYFLPAGAYAFFFFLFCLFRPGGSSDIHFVHYSHYCDQKGVTVKNVPVQSGSKNELGELGEAKRG